MTNKLKIETSESPAGWTIVQIYADSEDDFENAKYVFTEITRDIEDSYSNADLSSIFDEFIGKEESIDGQGNINKFIFSAPNDDENYWRIDIYVTTVKGVDGVTENDDTSTEGKGL